MVRHPVPLGGARNASLRRVKFKRQRGRRRQEEFFTIADAGGAARPPRRAAIVRALAMPRRPLSHRARRQRDADRYAMRCQQRPSRRHHHRPFTNATNIDPAARHYHSASPAHIFHLQSQITTHDSRCPVAVPQQPRHSRVSGAAYVLPLLSSACGRDDTVVVRQMSVWGCAAGRRVRLLLPRCRRASVEASSGDAASTPRRVESHASSRQ